MRRALPLALLLIAAPAWAVSGVNLRWTDCYGDGGTLNRTFACTTNSGQDVLVGSFVSDAFPQATMVQSIVDFAVAGATLPAWWQFVNAGSCRQSSLTVNVVIPPAAVVCQDWGGGAELALLTSYTSPTFFGANTARVRLQAGVLAPYPDLVAGVEYFAFNLRIDHAKTTGAGACTGCANPACMVLRQVTVFGPPEPLQRQGTFSGPTGGAFDSFYAMWQGGAGVTTFFGTGCPHSVPARRENWSRVKAFYR